MIDEIVIGEWYIFEQLILLIYVLINFMDITTDDLTTFIAINQEGTFTAASKTLGLSQSALSQKIARIEDQLHTTLFIRHPRSLSLTPSGEEFLNFATEMLSRQKDFLNHFNQYDKELSGVIRVAEFSSVMRSIVIPKLTGFMREHPKVHIQFSTHEMFELHGMLKSNQADFIITDYFLNQPLIEQQEFDQEEYVIIEPKKYKNVPHVFIDHGPHDNATETYFRHIGKKADYERIFMGEVYSIIDGVAAGLGKAVMSKHLIENDKRFKISSHKKRYIRPVVLSYLKQNYYSPLSKIIIEILGN